MESTHISALNTKHAGLERQLRDEMTRPAPDQARVKDLKRRKLRIKEQISLN